jgi:hypothetical protein
MNELVGFVLGWASGLLTAIALMHWHERREELRRKGQSLEIDEALRRRGQR